MLLQKWLIRAFSITLTFFSICFAAETLPYSGFVLSLPPDVKPRDVVAVNDNGDVVFTAYSDSIEGETKIRYRDGTVTNLWEGIPIEAVGYKIVDVYALNNKGQALIVFKVSAPPFTFVRVAINDHGRVTLFPTPGDAFAEIRNAFLTDAGKIIVSVHRDTGESTDNSKAKFWTGKKWEAFPTIPGFPHHWVFAVNQDGTAYGLSMPAEETFDFVGGSSTLKSAAVCLFRPGQTIPISPLRGSLMALNERGDFVMGVGNNAVFQPRGKPSITLGRTHDGFLTIGDVGNPILSPNGALAYAVKTSSARNDYHIRLPDGSETVGSKLFTQEPLYTYVAPPTLQFHLTDAGVINLWGTNKSLTAHLYYNGQFISIADTAPGDQALRRLVDGAIREAGPGDAAPMSYAVSRSGVIATVLYEDFTDNFEVINPSIVLLRPGRAEVRALEITQVVQDWNNSIPLIAGKQTFVRGHIEATMKDAIGKKARGKLRAFKDGAELAGSPLAPVNKKGFGLVAKDAALVRDKLGNALDFILPLDWCTNTVEFRLESFEGDFLTRATTVTFTNVQPMLAKIFPLTVVEGTAEFPTPESDALLFREAALNLLPVPGIESGALRNDVKVNIAEINKEDDLEVVNSRLRLALLRDADGQGLKVNNARDAATQLGFYFGVTENLGDFGGIADEIDGTGSTATFTGLAGAPNRGAHEIAHLLSQQHAVLSSLNSPKPNLHVGFCEEYASTNAPDFPFFGKPPSQSHPVPLLGPIDKTPEEQMFGASLVDGKLKIFSPLKHFELMGYCDKPNRWISGYTYTNILNQYLAFRGPAPAAASRLFMTAAPVPRMIVRGTIDLISGAATLEPSLPLSPGPLPAAPAPGDYLLEFRNIDGTLLGSVSFGPSAPVELESRRSFMFVVARPEGTTRLAVLRNNQTLATLGSTRTPDVHILAPSGVFSGLETNVSWATTDHVGPLRFVVDYSPNGGVTWTTLGLDVTNNFLGIRPAALQPTQNGVFRVTACDGVNFTSDVTDSPIIVPVQAPTLAVLSPFTQEQFEPGDSILFHAASSAALTGISWQSDRDGLIGQGARVLKSADTLSPGLHQITVNAQGASPTTFPIFIAAFETPRIVSAVVDTNASTPTLFLNLQSGAGINVALESSTNLISWTPVTNIFAATEETYFEFPLETGARFFRVAGALAAPEILAEPEDIQTQVGFPGQISVTAAGSEPLTYIWLRNGIPLASAPNQPALLFSNSSSTNSGNYSVIVSNRIGIATSRVASINFTNQAPTISSGPGADQCFREGFFVGFRIRASGIPEPTYQWFHNNQPITGATDDGFFIESPTTADLGDYFVRVTNEAGSIDSAVVKLKICP